MSEHDWMIPLCHGCDKKIEGVIVSECHGCDSVYHYECYIKKNKK